MISFLICSNGYGHMKRVLSVIPHLLETQDNTQISLFCKQPQIELAIKEVNFRSGMSLNFYTDASENEINWLTPEGITFDKYGKWKQELSQNNILKESKLVISDNHVLPIGIFQNVLLMGSFLWHDVVTFENSELKDIIENEKMLLQSIKTDMICLSQMAMNAVNNQTNAIKSPWFCEPYFQAEKVAIQNSILITGGGTALINNLLAKLAHEIQLINPELDIFVDSKIYNLIENSGANKIKKFNFTEIAFTTLKAIVCRPGIGIITDCIRYRIPIITINDGFNKEIEHNAKRIMELGIGINLNSFQMSLQTIAGNVSAFLKDNNLLYSCQIRIREQKTGGAKFVANYIKNKIR